jgi:hypothetical protein
MRTLHVFTRLIQHFAHAPPLGEKPPGNTAHASSSPYGSAANACKEEVIESAT